MERQRGYDLVRVVYPDPTTNERGVLERHGKYVVEAMVRSGATALRGSFTQIPRLGARSGVWNDLGSPYTDTPPMEPYAGR